MNQDVDSLDPADWEPMRALAHEMVDAAVVHLRDVRARPVWREMPGGVRAAFATPLPEKPLPLGGVWREIREALLPYPMGNIHPRFWMWYMGSGSFTGALGEFLAAIEGSNLGGGNNAATLMDAQVVRWVRDMMGFPETASGTLVDGGSKANIIGLTVARNAMAGVDVREEGVAAIPAPLRFYASSQVHSCHQKAVELLGLGNRALRRVGTDEHLRLDLRALEEAIAVDRAGGLKPACVIGTAGTTNTGAVDDLRAIATLCRREGLWFHVDGCIGALLRLAPDHRHLVAGLEEADSLALDLHKWLHAPFEAGCALVRDAALHRGTFAVHPEYLEEKPRGAAAAEYPHDYNLQTSRGFRALKLWMILKEHGTAKFGRMIDRNIAQARRLAAQVEAHPELVLMTPVTINVVCFRYAPPGLDEVALRAVNTEIMLRLQEEGIASISDTELSGHHCLRAAICNHRTRDADLELLVDEVLRLGREVLSAP
ncbi:pyridoxal phosphate-dependent decarboxylase family protein [Falsiroseomonas sp. E2-1-a20]|uniref:pyridoxal phosphate-dependent decarboxylase family protein n=1 Tax=Falsiroseomonas sp. E2-1-a20 TaxID=3239300 RepID=UPI003F3F3C40